MLIGDYLVGRGAFGNWQPTLAAGACVTACVALARVNLLAASLAASAASCTVSVAVGGSRLADYAPIVGYGSWPSIAELLGLAGLTIVALRALPPPAAAAAAVSLAAALAALSLARENGPYSDVFALLLVVFLATVVTIGLYVRALDTRREREAGLARQDERLTLARELHDVVAHHMSGIVVQAQAAQLVARREPESAMTALAKIENAGHDALTAMRAMVGTLRADSEPAPSAPAPTLADLDVLAAHSIDAGLPARIEMHGVSEGFPADVAVSVHRIVREALANARRHAAGATLVSVTITRSATGVRVLIRDDGAPRRPARSRAGYGLTGMAERAHGLGGTFAAGPDPRGGWRVEAELPVRGSQA